MGIMQRKTQSVSIKMGSQKLKIEVTSTTTSLQVIESVLNRCKIDKKLAKTYGLFESISGIERQLHNTQTSISKDIEYSVRKCLATKHIISQSRVEKYYRKLSESPESTEKQNYLDLIMNNQAELEKQTEQLKELASSSSSSSSKMCNQHYDQLAANLANNKLANNINFLQFLYFKLKKQNSNGSVEFTENMNHDYEQLLNSCGNSSDEETCSSNGSSRTSASSICLESLV